ncbi:MAG: hypothetical protein QM769_03125 [Pseudoxanthomonas sp.]
MPVSPRWPKAARSASAPRPTSSWARRPHMSPEQCLGAKDVDAKTDVYAMGIILFEMLAGRPPFVAERPGEFLTMHMLKPPPLLTQFVPLLPSKLVGLVHGMLAKEPTARLSMEQVALQLQRLSQSNRDVSSLQLPTLASDSGERATVQAKALGGRRNSGEIVGAELGMTTPMRAKKAGASGPQTPTKSPETQGVEASAFDPTSPGDPDFVSKLDDIADNASTVPVQSMRLNDIHPAMVEKLREAAAAASRPADAAAPGPPSGPGSPSTANWVPMEIVKTDYSSTPDMPGLPRPKVQKAKAAPQGVAHRFLPGLLLIVALFLMVVTAFLIRLLAAS